MKFKSWIGLALGVGLLYPMVSTPVDLDSLKDAQQRELEEVRQLERTKFKVLVSVSRERGDEAAYDAIVTPALFCDVDTVSTIRPKAPYVRVEPPLAEPRTVSFSADDKGERALELSLSDLRLSVVDDLQYDDMGLALFNLSRRCKVGPSFGITVVIQNSNGIDLGETYFVEEMLGQKDWNVTLGKSGAETRFTITTTEPGSLSQGGRKDKDKAPERRDMPGIKKTPTMKNG